MVLIGTLLMELLSTDTGIALWMEPLSTLSVELLNTEIVTALWMELLSTLWIELLSSEIGIVGIPSTQETEG